MRRILLLAIALTGCSIDQSRLGNFVNQTVQPGMPMEQALVRMQAEGFYCNAGSGADAVIACTRTYTRLVQKNCVERVDLVRSATAAKTLGAIDVLEVKCPK
ncbi:hypothetical protein GJ697_10530 [Pseudoduganella sp. FT25W]|jgi:hypothetical protein|uniref:Uncharacterized protein n=1 Tax=Duganella alba TaxID=2666081 RepID=A0A6L5QF96_9BURK|nr:hypothetical protein [Duganella alba]MRX08270.1 hypothetical protein [Duganella alba]MRX16809.1 hypothetical protein [Duganella alba]